MAFGTIKDIVVYKSLSKRRRSVFLSHTLFQQRYLNCQVFRRSKCPFTVTFPHYLPQISVRAEGTEKYGNKAPTLREARSVSPKLGASHDCSYIKYVCVYHSNLNHFTNMSLWCSPGTKIPKASVYRYENE